LEFKRRIEKDAEAREAYQRHLKEEKERLEALRQVIFWCLVTGICSKSQICVGFSVIFYPYVSCAFKIQSRVMPDTMAELIEYFLDTEAQEIEYEIARLRPRQVVVVCLI